jgi:hypothetical protein
MIEITKLYFEALKDISALVDNGSADNEPSYIRYNVGDIIEVDFDHYYGPRFIINGVSYEPHNNSREFMVDSISLFSPLIDVNSIKKMDFNTSVKNGYLINVTTQIKRDKKIDEVIQSGRI